MRLGDVKQWIYLFPARWIASLMPIPLVGLLGRLLAWCDYATVRPANRQRLTRNIASALGLGPYSPKAASLAHAVVRNHAWRNLEYGQGHRLWRCRGRRFLEIVGFEVVEEAIRSGRGVLMAGGHLATDELNMAGIAWYGCRSALVEAVPVRPETLPRRIDRAVGKFRAWHQKHRLGYETIHTGAGLRKGMQWLRGGRVVGIAVDIPPASGGVIGRFMGFERAIPVGAAHLALKADAVVVMAHLERIRFGRNRLTLQRVDVPRRGDFRADREALARKLVGIYERFVRSRPDQWAWPMWSYLDAPEAAPLAGQEMPVAVSRADEAARRGFEK